MNASGTEEDIVAGGARALASLRGGAANASSTSRAAEEELKRAEASLASSEAMLETYQERLSSAGAALRVHAGVAGLLPRLVPVPPRQGAHHRGA